MSTPMILVSVDLDGRPFPQPLLCPKCGYGHSYTWGSAAPKQRRPNGGCPQCKHTWELATGKATP